MMKNLRTKQNILLIALSLVVWVGVCCLAMHWNTVYAGAIGSFPTYLWVFAPVSLLCVLIDTGGQKPDKGNSRLGQALAVYIVTFLLYAALLIGVNPLYEIGCWWLVLLLVLAGVITLCGGRVTRALKNSPLRLTAYTIFLLYLSYAAAQLGMIAVLHPVSVAKIKSVGEAEGGEYMSRIGDDSPEHPLGVYFFISSDDGWCYYDVLTGAPADDYHSRYEPAQQK